MQLSKLFNTENPNMKYICYMFLPILVMVVIQYAVVIGDVLILFVANIVSGKELDKEASIEFIMNSSYNQPMNLAYMTLVQYLLYITVFGIWFYRAFCKDNKLIDISDSKPCFAYAKDKLIKVKTLFLIAGGYAAQLFVDGILTLVEPYFKEQFAQYGKMVDTITGVSSSWVLLFAVIVVAPIGEELLFRGVIQSYGLKNFAPVLAIGLQGLIFGLYHGNIIQGIYAFFMGVVLGFVAYKTGTILTSLVLHISINGSLLLVPEVLYEGTGRTVATSVVSGAVFAVMMWLVVRNKSR
ncbi:MAG: CPBP family intramembrane metalloprotease [Lachnospiraceae bacterium]|nr:CPBP family intramembrane metalloprotease [Lachnospiraceae bacterium]